jgi:uncharacterized protein YukJ
MPIPGYGVLAGDPAHGAVAFSHGKNPHYRIYMKSGQQADVNIQSQDGSEVLYLIRDNFTPPDVTGLLALTLGSITLLDSSPAGLALDYVRETIAGAPMVTRNEMQLLPVTTPGESPDNRLKNAVIAMLDQAVVDPAGVLYVFGQTYSDQGGGVHDIHMNQGNPAGSHSGDNGSWQDGALFVHLPANDQWMALFIAFQTESWQNDDNGIPLNGV